MKFVCLGYMDESTWAGWTEEEQNAFVDECFAYDDVLRKGGHFAGGEGLDSAQNSATLRFTDGKVSATAGTFIETKDMSERSVKAKNEGKTGERANVRCGIDYLRAVKHILPLHLFMAHVPFRMTRLGWE